MFLLMYKYCKTVVTQMRWTDMKLLSRSAEQQQNGLTV